MRKQRAAVTYFGSLVLVIGFLASPSGTQAQDGFPIWNFLDGQEVIVATGSQQTFAIDSDSNGGAVVAWEHGVSGGIRAQRLDYLGGKDWSAGGIFLSATGIEPAIVGDGYGGAVVAWVESNGIWMQRIDASGLIMWLTGDTQVATSGNAPVLVADGSGGAFIAWSNPAARVSHVNGDGNRTTVLDGLALGSNVSIQGYLDLVSDDRGGIIAAWSDASLNIVVNRVNAGYPWGTTPTVVSNASSAEGRVVAARDGNGGVLVAWNAVSSNVQMRARRVDRDGTPMWATNGEVVVDSAVVGGDVTFWLNYQDFPTVVPDDTGGAIVAWWDWRHAAPGSADDDVYVQRLYSSGARAWTANGILLAPNIAGGEAPGSQRAPKAVSDGLGGVIVTYQDYFGSSWDISASRLNIDGGLHWSNYVYIDSHLGPGYTQIYAKITYDESGPYPAGAVIGWADNRNGGYDLYAQKMEIGAPANNVCSNAEEIEEEYHLRGTLAGGFADGSSTCGGVSSDAWYRWVAPWAGTLYVNTCGTHDDPLPNVGIDTVLSLHSTCPGDVSNELICNDDWDSGSDPTACTGLDDPALRDSAVALPVVNGQVILIRVSRYSGSRDGEFKLNIGFVPAPPANDACTSAMEVGPGQWVGSLISATNDGDSTCGGFSEADVWYDFVAPLGGFLHISTCGTNDMGGPDQGMDSVLSVHDSCPGDTSNEMECNDDWQYGNEPAACSASDLGNDQLDSALTMPFYAGQAMKIRVAQYDPMPAEFFFNFDVNFPSAGMVPDRLPQPPLLIEKLGGNLRIFWGPSCLPEDTDYALYAGVIGVFDSHEPVTCTTGGVPDLIVPIPSSSTYFLAVPHNEFNEGSYGVATTQTTETERPQSALACLSQFFEGCPP